MQLPTTWSGSEKCAMIFVWKCELIFVWKCAIIFVLTAAKDTPASPLPPMGPSICLGRGKGHCRNIILSNNKKEKHSFYDKTKCLPRWLDTASALCSGLFRMKDNFHLANETSAWPKLWNWVEIVNFAQYCKLWYGLIEASYRAAKHKGNGSSHRPRTAMKTAPL